MKGGSGGGDSNDPSDPTDRKGRDGSPEWFDVGIIKGTTCTVSSFYLPREDGSEENLENEADESLLRKIDLQVRVRIDFKKLIYTTTYNHEF